MASFTLAPSAVFDLEEIYSYGMHQFGETQAVHYNAGFFRQFDLLAQFPGMGLPVEDAHKPYQRFGYGSHIIIYSKTDDGVRIEFVFHARMDWLQQIASR